MTPSIRACPPIEVFLVELDCLDKSSPFSAVRQVSGQGLLEKSGQPLFLPKAASAVSKNARSTPDIPALFPCGRSFLPSIHHFSRCLFYPAAAAAVQPSKGLAKRLCKWGGWGTVRALSRMLTIQLSLIENHLLVGAKSIPLCFRLTAKTAPAPLLLVFRHKRFAGLRRKGTGDALGIYNRTGGGLRPAPCLL